MGHHRNSSHTPLAEFIVHKVRRYTSTKFTAQAHSIQQKVRRSQHKGHSTKVIAQKSELRLTAPTVTVTESTDLKVTIQKSQHRSMVQVVR